MRLNRLVPFRLRAEAYYMGGGDRKREKERYCTRASLHATLPPSLLIKND